jgi:hypothetical protein
MPPKGWKKSEQQAPATGAAPAAPTAKPRAPASEKQLAARKAFTEMSRAKAAAYREKMAGVQSHTPPKPPEARPDPAPRSTTPAGSSPPAVPELRGWSLRMGLPDFAKGGFFQKFPKVKV